VTVAPHNPGMSMSFAGPQVPVNRALVGVLSIACCSIAGVMALADSEGPSLWQGAFLRVGVVLAAFWLALPSRTREAAWVRIPLWNIVGVLLVILVATRIPLKLLIPGLVVFGIALMLLRPRRRNRPAQRLFD
jgi:hypothetical protein